MRGRIPREDGSVKSPANRRSSPRAQPSAGSPLKMGHLNDEGLSTLQRTWQVHVVSVMLSSHHVLPRNPAVIKVLPG